LFWGKRGAGTGDRGDSQIEEGGDFSNIGVVGLWAGEVDWFVVKIFPTFSGDVVFD
jgi:hypothetical protein